MTEKPKYRVAKNNIPLREVIPMAGAPDSKAKGIMLRTQKVYGTETSIMFATRDEGYHTVPHLHDCEQFNIVLEGEIWFFVEEHGYCCRAGDVMRIPRNKVHWAWNRGPGTAVLVEAHSPPLTGEAHVRSELMALLGPDDDKTAIQHKRNQLVSYNPEEIARVEAQAIAEEEDSVKAAE